MPKFEPKKSSIATKNPLKANFSFELISTGLLLHDFVSVQQFFEHLTKNELNSQMLHFQELKKEEISDFHSINVAKVAVMP